VTVYLESQEKRPKIHVRKLQSAKEVFDSSSGIIEKDQKEKISQIETEKVWIKN